MRYVTCVIASILFQWFDIDRQHDAYKQILITSSSATVPLLGSTAPNVHASLCLPSMTNLQAISKSH